VRSRLPALLAVAALACAGERAASPAPPSGAEPTVLRTAELARVRCLLVAPFENGSDAPGAGEAATATVVSGIEMVQARVYPLAELRAAFRGTPVELPAAIGPAIARELASIAGTDAVLTGAVAGRTRDASPELLVTMRLVLADNNEVVFAQSALVRPRPDERIEDAVRREVLEAARPLLGRLGDGTQRRCFDPERTQVLRRVALAQAKAEAAPPPAPPPPPPPQAGPPPRVRTPRQQEWSRRLAAGERILVEDVAFAGRTSELQRDAGLADLAIAFASVRDGSLWLDGFVDATSDATGDQRLSHAMAQIAADRVAAFGIPRSRLAWAGRGGSSPLLPNFTLRGRAANRRIEAVVVR
jgi:outer membrane protein OmpA-like peptidoglycan-associated protein